MLPVATGKRVNHLRNRQRTAATASAVHTSISDVFARSPKKYSHRDTRASVIMIATSTAISTAPNTAAELQKFGR